MKNQKVKFSIIVPVCKTEQYLEQCLQSIKNQDFEDFECIVINDGSSGVEKIMWDKWQDDFYVKNNSLLEVNLDQQCLNIFNSIVGQDKRFRYIYQENQGVSIAKNNALSHCNGEWIQVIDSDDWIIPDFLQKYIDILNKFENHLTLVPYFIIYQCYNTLFKLKSNYEPKKVTVANSFIYPTLMAWNYIQRNEIIQKYNLEFEPRLGPGPKREDKIIKHGYDDTMFAAKYLEAMAIEYGEKNINFAKFNNDGYMYRDVDLVGKAVNYDNISQSNFIDYLQTEMSRSPLKSVSKISTSIKPWYNLWYKKNLISRIKKLYYTALIRIKSSVN